MPGADGYITYSTINALFNWLDEQTNGRLSGLIEWIKTFLNSWIETLKVTLNTHAPAGLLRPPQGRLTADLNCKQKSRPKGRQKLTKNGAHGMISAPTGM
jgi:hypothetical protein